MPERREITPEEISRFQAAGEVTEKALKEKWQLFSVEDRLRQLGATDETLESLGEEGVLALMTEAKAEEVRALMTSHETLRKSLDEMLKNPEVKVMAMFRLENLRKAYNQHAKIEEAREKEWQVLGEHLGQHPQETRAAEYQVKLEELKNHLKDLEARRPAALSADERNDLKRARATIVVIESQIAEIGRVKKDLTLEERKVIDEHRESLDNLKVQEQELRQSNPEAFLGLNHADFRQYTESLAQDHLVETSFVKEHLEDIETHLRADIPTMIYGHLGSGKTELAMYLSKTRFKKTEEQETRFKKWLTENQQASEEEKEDAKRKLEVPDFYMISGSKHIVPSEFYGHQTLTIPNMESLKEAKGFTDLQIKQFQKQTEQLWAEYRKWRAEHKDINEKEAEKYRQSLFQVACAQLGTGTISDYVLGPVYEAMKEGRPVIIDEVNSIPHEVLISLNYILTSKAGDEITVQQDTGMKIKIKKGFCIMMTGNLNQGQTQYEDREEMDPAFLSRLHRVEYKYLPQEKEGLLADKRGPQNELYHLILAKMADKDGNIVAPEGSLEKLWRLAQAARIIQNVFAGREVDSGYYYQEAGGRGVAYMLKKSTLSLREMGRILDAWKGDNFRYELDRYLYNDFVGQAIDLNDRAYLYQVLQRVYGFFKTPGWEQQPSYGTTGQVRSFDIKAQKNKAPELEFLGPKEVIEAAFGPVPERTDWPELKAEEKGVEEETREYMVAKEDLAEKIADLKKTLPKDIADRLP